jgi:hypothetical protein
MMKLKERLLIILSLYFWSVMLFWYFGSPLFFFLTVAGIIYAVIGGKKHA